MSDIGRRMAYRNAARTAFYQNENEQLKSGAQVTKNTKIYHAHGYVIHSDNCISGDEIWERDSAFSEVFFDFDKAKSYLLEKFECLLKFIFSQDEMFIGLSKKERDDGFTSPEWRKEYIEEYIDYNLIISELTPEYVLTNSIIDFTKPQKIDWYLRYNGEVHTRYYVFGNKEYECRERDLLVDAGTNFKVGDLVIYNDWEYKRNYPGIYVVFAAPQKPNDKKVPWENKYQLVGIEGDVRLKSYGMVEKVTIHEGDLERCNEIDERYSFKEPLSVLQKVISGEIIISPELKDDILSGKVLFNSEPSWRDFPELAKGSK